MTRHGSILASRRREVRAPGRAIVAILAALLVAPSIARAAEPSAQDRATARALFVQGTAKRREGDLDAAYRAFRAADGLMGVPTTALRRAEVELELGRLVEAHESLARATRYAGPDASTPAFARAMDEARAMLAALQPRLPTLVVTVAPREGGALPGDDGWSATLDGRPLVADARGVPVYVDPGLHVVTMSLGGAQLRREVTLAEGARETVTFAPPSAAAPSALATAPAMPTVAPPALLAPVVTMPAEERGSPWSRPLVVTGIVIAGAGLAIGAATGIVALDRSGGVRTACPDRRCGPEGQRVLDEADTFATASTVGFVAFGVGAAVAGGALLLAPRSPAARALAPSGIRVTF